MSHQRKSWRLILALLVASSANTAENNATDLVKRMEQLLWAGSNRGRFSMTIETPHWQRTLNMHVWMIRPDKTFIRILSPKKERGVGSLRLGGEMWNYIPKIDRIIKIPPSMMLQPWMGSDFSNDDLVKESSLVTDYEHQVVESLQLNGHQVVRVLATAKPDAPVVWGKIELWLRVQDYIPSRQVFYDEHGKAVKELVFDSIQLMDGRQIPTSWLMTPLDNPDQRTWVTIHEMEFDIPIDDVIFTRRNLRDVR